MSLVITWEQYILYKEEQQYMMYNEYMVEVILGPSILPNGVSNLLINFGAVAATTHQQVVFTVHVFLSSHVLSSPTLYL